MPVLAASARPPRWGLAVVNQPGEPVKKLSVIAFGLDGYRSVALIEDALADDVLIAEQLNGRPLDSDHGAPARLVSPSQYGFVSTKHLCRIELHTAAPTHSDASLADRLLAEHPRARVWKEERHRHLPAWSIRPIYRLLIPPVAFLSARGSQRE